MSTSIRLLVIDDFAADVMIYYRYILRSKLQGRPELEYEIVTAMTGEQGLQMYSSEEPDCVLLDYSLPDMTGLEFIEELQQQGKELSAPIILATGYEDPGIHAQALEQGISGCYIKGKDNAARLITLLDQAMSMH